MRHGAAMAVASVVLASCAVPVLAVETSEAGQAFVDAFAEACVPGRLSYEATRDAAVAAGWTLVGRDSHPELASTMSRMDEVMIGEGEGRPEAEVTLYGKELFGKRLHLTVARLESVISQDQPPFVQVGCNLYDFDATGPVDAALVTAMLDTPIADSIDRDGIIGHVWGPACSMPRTFDTYLSYVAPGTPASEAVGFSGVTLNFSTSSPTPGEVVPETYC